jgi:hypothetical protein
MSQSSSAASMVSISPWRMRPTKVRLFLDLLADRFVEHRKWMT